MAERAPHRMRRAFVLGALMLVSTGVLALRSHFAWNEACTLARRNLPQMLGLEIGIGRCEIDPVTQALKLYGVSAYAPGSQVPVFAADEAEVEIDAVQPLFGRLRLERVQLTRPRINLDLSTEERKSAKGGAVLGKPVEKHCPLAALDRVQIGKLTVKDADVRLALPGGRKLEVLGLDVGWKLRRGTADVELEARRGSLALGPGKAELALTKLSAEAAFEPSEATLEVTRADIALDDIAATVSGKIEQLCDPSFTVDGQVFLPMKTVARALGPAAGSGKAQPASGHLWAGVAASGKPTDPHLSLDLVGTDLSFAGFRPGDFTAKVAWAGRDARLSELNLSIGTGTVHATGSLTVAGNMPLKLKAEFENVELARVLERIGIPGAWVNFPVSGRGAVAGHLIPSPMLSGDAELKTGHFVLAARPYDAPSSKGRTILTFEHGSVTGQLKILGDHVEVEDVILASGGNRLRVEGSLYGDTQRGLELRGKAESLDLGNFERIAHLPWSGQGDGTFSIRGPYANVAIDAALNLRDLEFSDYSLGVAQTQATFRDDVLRFVSITGQKGRTPYFGSGTLDFRGEALHTRLDLSMPHGRMGDLVDAIVRLHSSLELFQGVTDGEVEGSINIDSDIGHLNGLVGLAMRHVTYFGRPIGDGEVRMRFVDGQTLDLERGVFDGPVGRFTAQGRYAFDGPLDFSFRGDNLSLAQLVGVERAKSVGASATFTLDAKISGDDTVPLARGFITAPKLLFAGKSLGPVQLEASIQGRDLQLWGKPFDDAQGELKLRMKDPLPYEATLTLALPEIRPLLPSGAIAQGLSGSAAGSVHAKGLMRDPSTLKAEAQLDRLTLTRGDFTGHNEGPISMTYQSGTLDVKRFDFKGPNTELTASGRVGDQLDFKLAGGFDMRLVEGFVPQIERAGGRVELSAAANGTIGSPTVIGSARLLDARFDLRDRPFALRGMSADVEFSESRVLVHDARGTLNNGQLGVLADLSLDHFHLKTLDVSLDLDEVHFPISDDLPATFDGQLHLGGKPSSMLLSGALDVSQLRYEKDLALDVLLKNLATARPTFATTGSDAKLDEWLRFDVGISLKDVQVQNNLAHAPLVGKVQLTGNNVRPGLVGAIEAGEGSQAFLRNTRFSVRQGTLEFKSRNSIDTTFDLHADTQVRDYLVQLHAFGKPSAPQVHFTSEPQLSEGDIVSLLTIGVTSKDKSNTANAGIASAAEALFVASGFDSAVARVLPKTPFLQDSKLGVVTSFNEATGLVEPAAQLESKVLTERLKLGLNRPLLSGRGTRVRLEYSFDKSVLFQLQWDNEDSDYSFGNVGADLKLRWDAD